MVFIGVDLDQIDKMVPRRVKSAPGAIELNQHFGAETDLLDLKCRENDIQVLIISKRLMTSSPMMTEQIEILFLRI